MSPEIELDDGRTFYAKHGVFVHERIDSNPPEEVLTTTDLGDAEGLSSLDGQKGLVAVHPDANGSVNAHNQSVTCDPDAVIKII